LKARHYEILARLVKGESQRQIAKEMDIGEPRLSVIVNSPVFQDELNKRLRVKGRRSAQTDQ
jgi:FixJ family two-component response regulator